MYCIVLNQFLELLWYTYLIYTWDITITFDIVVWFWSLYGPNLSINCCLFWLYNKYVIANIKLYHFFLSLYATNYGWHSFVKCHSILNYFLSFFWLSMNWSRFILQSLPILMELINWWKRMKNQTLFLVHIRGLKPF